MYTYCIAEDEFYVQKSIMGRIRTLRADLTCMGCAYTGEEAEKLYDQVRPDLFFVDINMPETDGISFIASIRRKDPHSRTLFVIISGYSDYRSMHRAIRVDVFDYLQKPIVPEEFAAMISRVMGSLEKGQRETTGREQAGELPGEERGPETDPAGEERIRRICHYIQTHYREEISAAKVGEIFYLSQSHIAHLFRKYTGTSLGKYLEDVRLEQADQLLRNTGLSITQIAKEVGYHDSNYFTKCFRKKYSASPTEVRSKAGRN